MQHEASDKELEDVKSFIEKVVGHWWQQKAREIDVVGHFYL